MPRTKNSNDERRAERDRMVVEHLPLVKSIALRVHDNLPVHVDLDEMIQAGVLGLFEAADKFDAAKNVTFSSFAKHRIKGAILDNLRQADWASREMRRRQRHLEATTRELAGQLKRSPTEDEVAERLGVRMERWRQMMVDLRSFSTLSASRRKTDDLPPPDFVADSHTNPDRMCGREELRARLRQALGTLTDRYQKVIRMYYLEDLTMKEIGAELNINESRVSQIHKAALEKLAEALEELGITSSRAF